MVEFQPFRSEHLRYLVPQVIQRHDHAILLNSSYASIIDQNFGLSAWDGSQCIGAAGVIPIFATRGVAWAILSEDASAHMLAIVRKARRVMSLLSYRRIEIAVRADFEEGNRFARLIGMDLETPEPMRAHGAHGEDEYMYAMVK